MGPKCFAPIRRACGARFVPRYFLRALDGVTFPAAVLALLIAGVCAFRRRLAEALSLGFFVTAAVVINNVICALGSGVHDRYQARVTWLVAFSALLIFAAFVPDRDFRCPAPRGRDDATSPAVGRPAGLEKPKRIDPMAGRKAIVFGGAGFIGCHLLKRLAAEQLYDKLHSVDIAAPRFSVPGVNLVHFDIRQPIPPKLCGEGPFDIYNLAAVHTTPGHEDWEYFWTNVHGATNVCRFASEIGAERILFTSTMMVYGPTEAPKDEEAALEPVNAYGRSKILAEGIHNLWQAERPQSRRLTVVRPGVIYGLEERGNFTRLSQALKGRRFFFPGRTDTIKACGYVEDLVSSMLYMQERNEAVTLYNFCHPERYTIADICCRFRFCRRLSEAAFRHPVLAVGACRLRLRGALGTRPQERHQPRARPQTLRIDQHGTKAPARGGFRLCSRPQIGVGRLEAIISNAGFRLIEGAGRKTAGQALRQAAPSLRRDAPSAKY